VRQWRLLNVAIALFTVALTVIILFVLPIIYILGF
jgi:hypothetical protein